MTITYPSTTPDLSRLYGPPAKPFRLNRRTALAVGVALGFHAIVGFYVVKSQFTPATIVYDDPGGIIVQQWEPPKPPPPPPRPRDVDTAQQPPKIHDPIISTETPFDPIPLIRTPDAVTPDGPVTVLPTADVTPATPTPPVTPPSPPMIRNPSWLKKPSADQISALYPKRALDNDVSGGATVVCEITGAGAVNNCVVSEETPKGYRFGDAALAMTKYFRLNPKTVDGQVQAGARVRIPIVFNLG